MEIITAQTVFGTFSYWPTDGIGSSIARGEFWEPWLKPAFDALPSGSVVVDAGANLGWFTIYAARRGCRVYAFEPYPDVFSLLVKNVRDNGLEAQVSTFPLALYSRCEHLGAIPLGPSNPAHQIIENGRVDSSQCFNSGSFALGPGNRDLYGQYGVPLDFFDFSRVDLIKIDTEGCDLEVLKGSKKTIWRCSPTICYEHLNPNSHGYSADDMNLWVSCLGYSVDEVYTEPAGTYREFVARRQA